MPQAGPTPIINLSYVNDKTTLMIQNDAVTIHADVTNFDPELLI
jgi:hypothetical protein